MRLAGKIALITGATSGIGAETARAFAREGADLVLSGRDADRGLEIRQETRSFGRQVHFVECRLGSVESAERLCNEALRQVDGIDILVNSAGVVFHHTVPETSDALWHETFDVNVHSVFYLSRRLVPHMVERGGGVIVNVASTWGLVGAEQTAAYCASKGALVQLSRAMAMDHAKDNVRINALCPGAVDTPMLEREAGAFGIDAEEGRALWGKDAADNCLATAADIAASAVFLASDDARHIHGIALPVDGGATAM